MPIRSRRSRSARCSRPFAISPGALSRCRATRSSRSPPRRPARPPSRSTGSPRAREPPRRMTNSDMAARSLAAVWHPCTQMKRHERLAMVPIARAHGPWLYDFDGRRYLDAVSSWWVNLFGHAHPAIDAALREQVGTLEHVILAGFPHQPAIVLAERLPRLPPPRPPPPLLPPPRPPPPLNTPTL